MNTESYYVNVIQSIDLLDGSRSARLSLQISTQHSPRFVGFLQHQQFMLMTLCSSRAIHAFLSLFPKGLSYIRMSKPCLSLHFALPTSMTEVSPELLVPGMQPHERP
ncbi:uncharacterized protein CLUP02_11209 [Colletotrichum lupini]|uniref:Uncharacterized protein n=1 Tax=Colletotrichum lupini TaxID=145971 RepID=A0A9Q8SYE8_9PEZI|nr:uncharacterized protein CLUP02_11209 [Colletotrichum lupini]UQC85710.1 hypothetical protein CLUP02_11209 [Colletotrichum lupini]